MKIPETHEKLIPTDRKSQALAISFSMLLLLAMSAISLSLWNSLESSHDAIAINLAGRQRMLSQQLEKNLLKLSYAEQKHLDTSLILQDLSRSYLLFDQTLTVLGKGKLVDQNGKTFTVASIQSKNAVELIKQANVIWVPMQDALRPIISIPTKLSKDTLEQALFIIMRGNQRLLPLMNSLTGEIENAAHKKSDQLRLTEVLAIGLILVNFGFVLLYFRRQLALLSESKLLSMRIMENVGTAIIVINAEGDIELSNHAAEHLFGYSTDKLTGENIKALIDEPFFCKSENVPMVSVSRLISILTKYTHRDAGYLLPAYTI